MSIETGQKDPELVSAAPSAPSAASADPIESLMAEGETPLRKPDLQQKALAAAEAAIAQGEAALCELAENEQVATRRSSTKIWMLRVLLAGNVALMVVMLLIPSARAPRQSAGSPAQEGRSVPGTTEPAMVDPEQPAVLQPAVLQPKPGQAQGDVEGQGHTHAQVRRSPPLKLKDDKLYEQALVLGAEGKYAEAILAIEQYLKQYPDLPSWHRMGIYQALHYYLTKEGRVDEARACVQQTMQLMERSFLPEDLLQGAHLAQKSGNGPEMRKNYARFLLLQKTLPAALRKHITEAYLKLGDSYRLEAESGEQRGAESRSSEPRSSEPRSSEPRGNQPGGNESGGNAPGNRDSKRKEPR